MVWSHRPADTPSAARRSGRPVRTAAPCSAALIALSVVHVAAAQPLLLDFTTPGCGPCREMRPVLTQLAQAGFAVREIDASRDPQTTAHFGVNQFPTFIAVVDGREYARVIGKTSAAELARMLRDAGQSGVGAPVSPAGAPATFRGASSPPEANNPFANASASVPSAVSPAANAASPASFAPATPPVHDAASVDPAADLVAATVRLRIQDGQGASTGSGTVIDARQGYALILTCGHLFRGTQGQEPVEVSFFALGPQGVVQRGQATGRVLAYDVDQGNDLGLVHVAWNGPLNAVAVATPQATVQRGDRVASVGCSHGEPPTLRPAQVTHINRYRGAPNVEASGAPVEGRSGGGLFNARGELIGVCFAADPQDDEGLYVSSAAICSLLDAHNLAFVYRGAGEAHAAEGATAVAQATTGPAASLFDEASAPVSVVRGQGPTAVPAQPLRNPADVALAAMVETPTVETPLVGAAPAAVAAAASLGDLQAPLAEDRLTPAEQATWEEIQRRGAQAEVICIIRPLTPDAACDVIKVNNPSPAFLRRLQAGWSSGSAATTGAMGTTGEVLRR
jgi:thiol-disulfide isomerase/thioredoxin